MTDEDKAYLRTQIAEISLFRNFTADELERLLPYLELESYDDNTILFKEGDRGDYLCIALEGTIEIRKESISNKQTVIAKFGRGSIVGEMALIDQFPHSAVAQVTANSKLLIFSRERFEKFLEAEPQLGIRILREVARILSQRLRRHSGRFSDIF